MQKQIKITLKTMQKPCIFTLFHCFFPKTEAKTSDFNHFFSNFDEFIDELVKTALIFDENEHLFHQICPKSCKYWMKPSKVNF